MESYRSSFFPAYQSVVHTLSGSLKHKVTGRPAKSTTALVDKLERQKVRLSQVQDIAGCRVIVDDLFLQERALLALEVYLKSPTIFDRRASSSHGYRAIHLVANIDGRRVEVQLRTQLQHLWAEISEKLADTVDPAIKYGVGDPVVLRFLENLSRSIKLVEEEESKRRDLLWAHRLAGTLGNPRARIEIKKIERQYFSRRGQLMQLLQDAQGKFKLGVAS